MWSAHIIAFYAKFGFKSFKFNSDPQGKLSKNGFQQEKLYKWK